MKFIINDALSSSDITKYKDLVKVSPHNFYFNLVAKFIPLLSTLKSQPSTTFQGINILGNQVSYKSDRFNNVTLTINGTSIVIEGLTPSVAWLKKLVYKVVEMEQENKVSINRPGSRTLVDDRIDTRKQYNQYTSLKKRETEDVAKFIERLHKYQRQQEHDAALQGTFFNSFYTDVVRTGTTTALKKNASQQPYYSVERFETAKLVNPSFKEENYELFDNKEVAFYVHKDIPVVDFTNVVYSYEGETRGVTEREATGYTDEWARIPEAVDFLEEYNKKGKGITVYHDIVTYMDDARVKQLKV